LSASHADIGRQLPYSVSRSKKAFLSLLGHKKPARATNVKAAALFVLFGGMTNSVLYEVLRAPSIYLFERRNPEQS
jgi:hypothetical protein